jgi:hypothetical protein
MAPLFDNQRLNSARKPWKSLFLLRFLPKTYSLTAVPIRQIAKRMPEKIAKRMPETILKEIQTYLCIFPVEKTPIGNLQHFYYSFSFAFVFGYARFHFEGGKI